MKKYLIIILSTFFAVLVSAQVRDYPHAKDAEKSDTYFFKVAGCDITVEKFKDIDYAHIELSKTAKVVVKINEPINHFSISPLNKKISGKTNGNELSFELPGAGYYAVSINNKRNLFILADAPEKKEIKETDKNIVSVMDFVTDNEGKVLQTVSLQTALDAASGSGKILYFPAGIYKTGMLTIRSNTHIYLAAGVLIKGSDNRNDYPSDDNKPESDHINNKENYTDYGEWMTFSRLIFIDKAENVKIAGRGIIDGNGKTIRDQGKPANLIRIRNSKNIVIEGVLLRDPAAWNTHILYSSDVTIRDVKILNDFNVPNTDGIDPDASKNVLIDHCFAYCNDDNIAIKTTNNGNYLQDIDNVKVKNCVFHTQKSALKVGTETKGNYMQNIVFENNDVLVSDRGIVFYCYDGATFRHIKYINNRFEKAFEKGQQRGIHISIKNRYGAGKIENILIKNNTFYTPFPKKSEISGLDNKHKVSNLKIKNLVIGGRKVKSLEEADIIVNEFVEDIVIK